jgi:hypothetical protein
MKVDFAEHDGCFGITLHAETTAEMAALVRFGMNRTDKLNSASTDVYPDGRFISHLVFAKSKRANSDVPKRK